MVTWRTNRQNGTRYRDGVKVLWCHWFPSSLVGFWGFHPYMCLFSFRKLFVTCNIYILICTSLAPRPKEEEEEKGPGFSRLHMRLIAMESHTKCTLLIYFLYTCDAKIDATRCTVHRFTSSVQRVKKLTQLHSSSGRFKAINGKCKLLWSQLTRRRGYQSATPSQEEREPVTMGSLHFQLLFLLETSLISSARLLTKALR